MSLPLSARLLGATALLLAAATAQADDYTLSGDLAFHNSVVQIDFTLAAAGTDVRIWTDSWLSGLNFDPATALWSLSGADHQLIAVVDDDDSVGPGQGYYDSGFLLPTLAAGQYRLTLVAASNEPKGTLLSQGFVYDQQAPIAIGQWNQPGYDPNANDQKGTFWRLHFAGVDTVSAVPEPASCALLLGGLLGVLGVRAAGRRFNVGPRP
jgi:hypothetical protein